MGGKGARRLARRDEVLDAWAEQAGVALERLDEGQKWVVYAGLSTVEAVAASRPLKRVVSFFLSRSEMDLPNKVVGAVVGVSDRAVQTTRHLGPKELVDVVTQTNHGHRPAKLEAHHAGLLAKYLVEHPRCESPELLAYIKRELGIEVTRHTLARYLKQYGLGCLRDHEIEGRPLIADTPATEAGFS